MKNVLFAFFASRVATAIFVYLGHWQREYLKPVPGGWAGVNQWWLNPWSTYDSQWFILIAEKGYQDFTTPFFPLYPLLLRLGGDTPVRMALAGAVISNLCFLFALLLLDRLTRIESNEDIAKRSVWLMAFFPTSAFFSAVYSESLFLLLLIATFLAARRQQWLLAGSLGLLAAFTRNPGFLIFLALLMDYLISIDFRTSRLRLLPLFASTLPLLGFMAVQVYFWLSFSSPFAGIASQSFYHRAPGWPWTPIAMDSGHLLSVENFPLVTLVHLVFIALAFYLALRYRKCLRVSYAILVFGILLMHLTYQRTIPPHTIGAVRYLSTTFPFVQLLARSAPTLSMGQPLTLILLGGYLFTSFIFSYLFGAKGFLG